MKKVLLLAGVAVLMSANANAYDMKNKFEEVKPFYNLRKLGFFNFPVEV